MGALYYSVDGRLTDWNHAFSVIVEIFLDDLQQTLDGTPSPVVARLGLALAQVLVLLLHLSERGGQASDHAFVGDLAGVDIDEQTKVEDELIALVLGVGDDDGVAEDGVFAIGGVYGDIAIAEGLPRDDVLLEDVEVNERRASAALRGGNASRRGLCDNLWSFSFTSTRLCFLIGGGTFIYLLEERIWRKRCLGSWCSLLVTLLNAGE